MGENIIVRCVPKLWAFGSMFPVVIGVVAGAANGGNRALHDVYYTNTFFLYFLTLAGIFIVFAGAYHWFPKLTGYLYSEKLAQVHFWLMFVGVNLTLVPHLFFRFWSPLPGSAEASNTAEFWNSVSAIGAFITMIGLGVFIIVVAEAFIRKRRTDNNE